MWTAEELEEMRRADAEIDADFCLNDAAGNLEDARAEKPRTISQKLKALYAKRYYERNKEKVAEYHKKWRAANREKVAAYRRAYYKRNREKSAASGKAYRAANRERLKKAQKEWREANRAKYAESQKRIRDRREMEGLTQKQFAKLMGVSNTTVSDWETGRRQANWELVLEVFPDLEPEL